MTEEREDYPTSRALTVMPDAGTFALASLSDREFEQRIATLRVQLVRVGRIQRELMDLDVDFGTIPGTPKPTLYKAGAEKLCNFYRYAPSFASDRLIGDGAASPPITWVTRCMLHLGDTSGPVVAEGEGSSNSWEKKHRYRTAERACPECGSLKTIIKGKPEFEKEAKYKGGYLCFEKKGGCGAKFTPDDPRIVAQQLGQTENPDPWDLDNTLLKMSVKRAYVDATLRGTATSGLFTQDLEDSDIPAAPTPKAEPAPAAAPPPPPPKVLPETNPVLIDFGQYVSGEEIPNLVDPTAAAKAMAANLTENGFVTSQFRPLVARLQAAMGLPAPSGMGDKFWNQVDARIIVALSELTADVAASLKTAMEA